MKLVIFKGWFIIVATCLNHMNDDKNLIFLEFSPKASDKNQVDQAVVHVSVVLFLGRMGN